MEPENLAAKRCRPCEGGVAPLREEEAKELMRRVPGWETEGNQIWRTFCFKNYFRTISFVNAVAWIAHTENHHPDLQVSYGACRVSYTTHAAGGLTENDFICAAKVDLLLPED